MVELAEGAVPWAIPWPCIYEFLRVVTHPRFFAANADRSGVTKSSGVTGNLLHDAHIATLCIEHGVRELITGDRDFSRFPIPMFNPFAE